MSEQNKTKEEPKKKLFNFVMSNPPYQVDRDTTKDMPVYNTMMDAAETVSERVEMITPARFLFNAGATPKSWNKKKLNDEHFKVTKYESDSQRVFPRADIKGGIAVTYRDDTKTYSPVDVFTPFPELNSIMQKTEGSESLNAIMYPYSTYTLSDALWADNPERKARVEYISQHRDDLSKEEKIHELSNLRIITTNIFDLWPEIFLDSVPVNSDGDYCCLWGRQGGSRVQKFIQKKYINTADNYENYKVLLPASNGSGAIGEVLSTPLIGTPLIGTPLIGYTQTFLGIGNFGTSEEAEACMKYIKSKFARCMLGILKITQHNPPEKWRFVPLQDFTSQSDIDWSVPIPEIDQQLYKKYGLDENEIEFIEKHIKPIG